MKRADSLFRMAFGAVALAVVMAVLPAAPAAAATIHSTHAFSGEGLDAVDDFNDVSTDGGATWTDAIIVPAQPAYSTISGTQWISSDAGAGVGTRENVTTLFRRGFSLPPGVIGSGGQVCVHADNAVTVKFNGTTVLTQSDPADSGNFSGAPECSIVLTNAASGRNVLDFEVQNGTGPMGLDFDLNLTWTQDPDALPTVQVPADVTISATSVAGATYGFGTVWAIDVSGQSIESTCTPSTGSLFVVGTATVTCTATGTNQKTGTGSFTVTVLPFVSPDEPPVLSLPADITLNAYSTSGRTVGYQATATDDSGIPPAVSCLPPSGSLFPVGATTVTCTATDDQQLTSTGSFTVTIIGPLQRACSLLQASLGITLKGKLVNKLGAAADALHQAGRDRDARTIRNLAQQVKNSGYTYIRPALRQVVRDTVTRVMARACCTPALPEA